MRRPRLLLLAAALGAASPGGARGAPTTLRLVAYYRTGIMHELMQQLVGEYNGSHPEVVVHQEYVTFDALKRHLLVANASGDLPDLAIVDNPDHAFFAEAGLFVDITDRVRKWSGSGRFFDGPWRSTFHAGRQYGVPFTTNCLALLYDKAALAAARVKVPETWDELRVAARKLTGLGRYGLAIGAIHSEEGTFQLLPWLLSAGGDVARLDAPGAVRSLEFLRSLITDGSMSPEVIGWTQNDVQKQFSAGKAAMAINGPWNFGSIERDSPGLAYGIAKVPRDVRFASVLGGENLAITRRANVEAAWDFVQYLTSREVMERLARRGMLPPRTDVLRAGERWGGDPKLAVFAELMRYATPRGPDPRWPAISNLLQDALQESLTGARTPREALADAQRRLLALRGTAPLRTDQGGPDGP